MHIYTVIKRPIITEKSNILAEIYGQYTFEVDRRANKLQVRALSPINALPLLPGATTDATPATTSEPPPKPHSMT